MNCPYCGDQIHSCGYVEIYHADDGTPMCDGSAGAKKRKQRKLKDKLKRNETKKSKTRH